MKVLGNIFLFLLCSVSLFSQQTMSVSGTLLEKENNEPVVGGSIELLQPKDSTYVAGTISSMKGNFTLKDLSPGNYILKMTCIGLEPLFKNISLSTNKSSVQLGNLYMETNTILLSEMIVEGKRPEIVVKNDTLEYDAGSFKTEENAVLEELLKKLPGVEVDNSGKITAGGKEVKKVLVDGKEFFSDDPQIASKNLPVEMIDKLQVVDRKSEMARMTGFDDGEEETVINLTIRPGMAKGTMGNILAGIGSNVPEEHDLRYQGGAFLNHMQDKDRYTLMLGANNNNNMGAADLGLNQFGGMRMRSGSGGVTETQNAMFNINKEFSSKLNLNGDIRFNRQDRNSIQKSQETTLSESLAQLDNTYTVTDYTSNSFSSNIFLEWKPDTLNTLNFRPNFRYNNSHSREYEEAARSDYNTGEAIYDSESYSKNKGNGISVGGTLDYAHKFQNKPGRVISLNLQGNYNNNKSQEITISETNKYIYNPQIPNSLNQHYFVKNNTNNYLGTVSFVEPIGRNNFIQLLYRYSYSDTKNINSTYDLEDEDGNIPSYGVPADFAILNDSLSKSTIRNATEQRIGLSFKAAREKYNYTIGINVDPSKSINETWQPKSDGSIIYPYIYNSDLANLRGDSLISSVEQDVVNISPTINFNYLFGSRTNLRIRYEGKTNQPSANQLRDFTDYSRPTNITKGNPNLKPGYSNTFDARFQKYVPETQLMYNIFLRGAFSFNDITSVTQMQDDGIRVTTYENVNGNWNTNLMGMFNTPLKNKKFSVSNFMRAGYQNKNSFVNDMDNNMKNFTIGDNLSFNYRSDLFDVGLTGTFNYSDITYSARPQNNQRVYSYGGGINTTWYLPYNWTIASDINIVDRRGYAEGYNIAEAIWNASISKQVFNKSFGSGSLKLQIYDILQDRNNITSNYTTNGFSSIESNSIPSYFMCSFIYTFTSFPKSSAQNSFDMGPGSPGERRGFGGPPPGGGGRPF